MAAIPIDVEKHSEINHAESYSDIAQNQKIVNEAGRLATIAEHDLTFRQAVKAYPRAIFWSVLVSTCIIMEGYDVVLVGSMFGQPAFQEKYGNYYSDLKGYQLSGPWQVALGNSGNIGAILGCFANGYFVQLFGYRRVLLVSLFLVAAFVFIVFFAQNLPTLLTGEILLGLPWGVFASMAPAYASEVCPVALRGYLTVYVNLCWAFGQLIGAGVNEGFQPLTTEWAYRVPFAIQWVWPIPLAAILFFAPESPWWLVHKERFEEAERTVKRLGSKSMTGDDAKKSVAMMCWLGWDVELYSSGASSCWLILAWLFLYYTSLGPVTYAIISETSAIKLRNKSVCLARIGYVGLDGTSNYIRLGPLLAVRSDVTRLILAWLFLYYTSLGPVTYAIISETSAIKLRNKSVCLARIGYYLVGILVGTIQPYMLNPTEGNWKGKTCLFWAGTSFLAWLWSYFRVPETAGRTYEELDILFANKVSARKFAKTTVDAYADTGESRIKQE
ncbi:related to alpha-glucoside transport protein [Phialocephala subalpina]|uniref:Related to alpha-glucoside transport protein n=1 Tax=Phialocephala subalpina TaxID=576137 RepID=A0A1L7X8Z8_9HELO|nr:related to alpha-glucoside transport protein [Phialocephala subalpina]